MSKSEHWGRLYESTFTGSMMGQGPAVFAVWAYVIAYVRRTGGGRGKVELNPRLLAALIGASEVEIRHAIEVLCSEDPESRSEAHNGRRLLKVGTFEYEVVNFSIYNAAASRQPEERREYNRQNVKRWRDRKAAESVVQDVIAAASKGSLDQPVKKHEPAPEPVSQQATDQGLSPQQQGVVQDVIPLVDVDVDVKTSQKRVEEGCGEEVGKGTGRMVTFAGYLQALQAKGESFFAGYQPVTDYAKSVGISDYVLHLHARVFRNRYMAEEPHKRKKYIDWRSVFLRTLKENWFRLWYVDNDGKIALTSRGKQADKDPANA